MDRRQKQTIGKIAICSIYVLLVLLAVDRVMNYRFTDGAPFLQEEYLLSQGFVPYVDFFDHHLTFGLLPFSPLFYLFTTAEARLWAYGVLSVVGLVFAALLIARAARRMELVNPHLAAIIFLSSIVAMPSFFVKSDFIVMLLLLIFLNIENTFIRGMILVLIGGTNPILGIPVMTAIVVYLWSLRTFQRAIWPLAGMGTAGIVWLLASWKIPFDRMIHWVFQLNNSVNSIYYVSLDTCIIFLLTVVPLVIAGLYVAMSKKETKDMSFILAFVGVYVIQNVLLNIYYGPPTRIRFYDYLPIVAIITIPLAGLRLRHSIPLATYSLIIALAAVPPVIGFHIADYMYASQTLDSCIRPNAPVYWLKPTEINASLPTFRPVGDYYWYFNYLQPIANLTPRIVVLKDEVRVCQWYFERSDLTCPDQTLDRVRNYCDENGPGTIGDLRESSPMIDVMNAMTQSPVGLEIKHFGKNIQSLWRH